MIFAHGSGPDLRFANRHHSTDAEVTGLISQVLRRAIEKSSTAAEAGVESLPDDWDREFSLRASGNAE